MRRKQRPLPVRFVAGICPVSDSLKCPVFALRVKRTIDDAVRFASGVFRNVTRAIGLSASRLLPGYAWGHVAVLSTFGVILLLWPMR